MASEELLASLGSLSCKCWSLATHIGQNSQSAWQSLVTGSSSHQEGWAERPQGPLLWFHALTLGETAVVLPVVFRCLLEYNEHVHVLLTTKSAEAIALLSASLPPRVIVQDVPLDSYLSMARFLDHFQPQACILMESPAWPVLVESCAGRGIRLGLLNARMSSRAFLSWFQPRVSRALLRRMMGSFSLVVPQSDIDVGRFRIFGATLTQMPGWCSDLKYAAALGNSVWHLWRPKPSRIASLRSALCGRPIWVAAHTQPGEEEAVATVHAQSAKDWPSLLTVLAPAAAGRAADVAEMLQSQHGLKVLVWSSVVDILAPQASKLQQQQQQQQVSSSSSWMQAWCSTGTTRAADGQQQQGQAAAVAIGSSSSSSSNVGAVDPAMLLKGVDVLLLDLLADLPLMYSVSEVAFIGNSLLEGCSGHNLAEAAVAGCAVLIGEHAGHFSTMADELNQAAVVAAEEASAAVNSSGPMEDPFFAAGAAAAAVDSGSGSAGAAGPSTSGAGGHAGPEHSHAAVAEGAESEEPSPRDGSHWRGVLNYTQHDDDQYGQYTDGSTGGGSRDGFSSVQQLQQHQQLQQLLQQQQSSLRPSSAPAAVTNTNAVAGGSNGSTLSYMQPPAGTRAAAPTPDSSSGGGGVYGLPGARNTAALLYRRQGRTGSSANSSCVGSPVASQRPSTAGGSAYGQPVVQQQQQHAMSVQQPQQEQRRQEGYLQQYQAQVQQQRQQQAQQQQQREAGSSPLQQQSSSHLEPANPQQQQQQPGGRAATTAQRDASTSGGGGGCCGECGPTQRCPAVDRPVPQAPPPSAASNTPVNGPTGTVTPITPAGSFGGANPALLQQPDSRDLALRLAQQQQQHGAAGTPLPRESDPLQEQQQQGGRKQPQDSSSSSSSAGGAQQPRSNDLRLSGNSSSGGGAASNAASTPLSCVADLYSLPFPRSPRALVLPDTPHPTPEDSAHTMGGRSPMVSGAGVGVTNAPDLAALQLQHPSELPSAEPSWQSAATSNGSDGGCPGSNGGAAGSSGGSSACQEAGAGVDCQVAAQSDNVGSNGAQPQQQQQQDADHPMDASLLQRPACPCPPCVSRASATSTVSNMPVFSSSSSGAGAGGPTGRSSRSRLGRTISSGGWQEEQQRQRHRQHLQGVVNGMWRGGSEGGSPMVAAILGASAAAEDSCSSDEDDYQGGGDGRRGPTGRVRRPAAAQEHASPDAAAAAGAGDGSSAANGVAEEDALAASLSGGCMGRLSAESSGMFDGTAAGEEGEGCSDSGNEDAAPFSRSPTFAELAACGRGSSNGGSSGSPAPHSSSGSGGKGQHGHVSGYGAVGHGVGSSGGTVGSQEGAGTHVSSSNGSSSMAGAGHEPYVPDLCPSERQLQLQQQQQLARLTSDQGSVGWEDWGQHHQQQQRDSMQQQGLSQPTLQCNGSAAGLSLGGGSSNWEGCGPGSEDPHARATYAAAAAGSAAAAAPAPPAPAAMRSSDGGGATSRLGDPRRSRRWQDLPSDGSPVSAAAESQPASHPQLHPQAPNAQQLQSLHQPQLLSYSGAGSAAAVLVGGGGAAGPFGSGTGGLHSSSSGGGGGVWLDPQSGMSTPASWGATPRAAPQQQQQQQPQQQHFSGSASNTPSASVTPRGMHRGAQGTRAGASSSHSSHHGHHSSSSSQHNWQHHQQQQAWQGNPSGRRSADIQQQQQGQQQFVDGGSSGGGSGAFYPMAYPLSRVVGDSGTYRRAESVTSMTSFTTSVGGDLMLHDDQPGSSRMSLIGENSSHLGYSTTGGRFSGFTGGPFASTGRFSECVTPHSMVTDVFRGQSEGEGVSAGGDTGALLNPGTSYLRYRGEYILPATQLPASPQGPAVWRVSGAAGLSVALNNLLQEPLERRSRGHAAAQAAAKLASGLVSTVWHVVDDMVVTPALQDFVAQGGLAGDAAAQHAARAPRIPGHPHI